MIKKLAAVITAVTVILSFASCSSKKTSDSLEATRASVDEWLLTYVAKNVEDIVSTYADSADEKGCETRFRDAAACFSVNALSDFGYAMEKCSATDISYKYSYNATTYEQMYYLYFDGKTENIALEIEADDESKVELLEVKKITSGGYALQHYVTTDDGRYNLTQMIVNDKNGSMSYSYDLSVRPTRLYTSETPDNGFSTEGDDVYLMENGSFEYTTTRSSIDGVSGLSSWLKTFTDGVTEYYNANKSKASEIDMSESYYNYMQSFTLRDIRADAEKAVTSGSYTSGMYVYNSDSGENIIVSFDGSSPNMNLRVTRGEDNYAFELREIGKRKYSMHYYTKGDDGLYTAYKMVLRFEGDSRVSKSVGLTTKPTLVYSKSDSDVDELWATTSCNYYFTVKDGTMKFIDVEKYLAELQAANELPDESSEQ